LHLRWALYGDDIGVGDAVAQAGDLKLLGVEACGQSAPDRVVGDSPGVVSVDPIRRSDRLELPAAVLRPGQDGEREIAMAVSDPDTSNFGPLALPRKERGDLEGPSASDRC
jgi:hypothetical protein